MAIPQQLSNLFGPALKANVSLAPFTYIKIGGPAEYFLIASTQLELLHYLQLADSIKLPVTLLGSASNVVISDQGIEGLVIINRAQDIKPLPSYHLEVSSGTLMSQLVHYCVKSGLAGLEEFLGIPGTVGGAIYNNSHHLNHLIGDYVHSIACWSKDQKIQTLSHHQCQFAYDSSIFQKHPLVILSVNFVLKAGDPKILKTKADQALLRRRKTQPLSFPNSGCMFKNLDQNTALSIGLPQGIVAAGWLVDKAGCKGMSVGGAKVSDQHANFILNQGTATASDVAKLSNAVRRRVHDKFGIWLEREVFFLGSHPELETRV